MARCVCVCVGEIQGWRQLPISSKTNVCHCARRVVMKLPALCRHGDLIWTSAGSDTAGGFSTGNAGQLVYKEVI